MGNLVYTVKFRPGRYKYTKSENPSGNLKQNTWIVGRDEDGTVVGFFFEENAAAQVCFALNLADAYITGDKQAEIALLHSLEKLKSVH